MVIKNSTTRNIARTLTTIIILSVLTLSLTLLNLSWSSGDTETINVAGSLRMQSYRLGWELATGDPQLRTHQQSYQSTLNNLVLPPLHRFHVPDTLADHYLQLKNSWADLQQALINNDQLSYARHISSYIANIDHFITKLQRHSEWRNHRVALLLLIGCSTIVLLAIRSVYLTRQQIAIPLNKLVQASHHTEQRHFGYPPLSSHLPNELEMLAIIFNRMSDELKKNHQMVAQSVKEKTKTLTAANRRLTILHEISTVLTASMLTEAAFLQILDIVQRREKLHAIEMVLNDHWQMARGVPDPLRRWQRLALPYDSKQQGELRWQSGDTIPPMPHMQSIAGALTRGLRLYQEQKHHQQMLLIRERTVIARELHDSLAQSLSFLRIQLTCLKQVTQAAPQQLAPPQNIIDVFDQVIAEACRQLRALMATFRLTIDTTKLTTTLQEMITTLRQQTTANLELHGQINTQALNAPQQIHIVHIIREAIVNAIKHADAKNIIVDCRHATNGDYLITVNDDGVGLPDSQIPQGHYGLSIMAERAHCLRGKLVITSHTLGGTTATLRFPSQNLAITESWPAPTDRQRK